MREVHYSSNELVKKHKYHNLLASSVAFVFLVKSSDYILRLAIAHHLCYCIFNTLLLIDSFQKQHDAKKPGMNAVFSAVKSPVHVYNTFTS